jgi:hypothetical protein
MPGFRIENIGGDRYRGIESTADYYTTYSWILDDIFDSSRDSNRSVVVNVKEMTLPSFSVAKEQVLGSSLEYKYAKSVSYDDVSIQWYDTHGLIELVVGWRKSVWDPELGLSVANVYKKDTVQKQYISYNNREVTYTLKGSWPSTIKFGDLSYANGDIKVVQVTVTYDWAIETVNL